MTYNSNSRESYGYLHISVDKSHLDLRNISSTKNMTIFAEYIITSPPSVSKELISIRNYTKEYNYDPKLEWIDDMSEFRCSANWLLNISVILEDFDNEREIILECEEFENIRIHNLITSTFDQTDSGIKSYDLYYSDNNRRNFIGSISLSMNYYQNHQSFICLCNEIQSNQSHSLIKSLLNELLLLITHSNTDDDDGDMLSVKDQNSYIVSSIHLHQFLILDENENLSQKSIDNLINYLTENHIIIQKDKLISTSKIITITRIICQFIQSSLEFAPNLSINLIEKMLSIYCHCLVQNVSLNETLSLDNPNLTINQTISFVVIVSLWLIQQSYLIESILESYNIEWKELQVIRNNYFYKYDINFDGNISSTDLPLLLQVSQSFSHLV